VLLGALPLLGKSQNDAKRQSEIELCGIGLAGGVLYKSVGQGAEKGNVICPGTLVLTVHVC
jgi:hypothetical protein